MSLSDWFADNITIRLVIILIPIREVEQDRKEESFLDEIASEGIDEVVPLRLVLILLDEVEDTSMKKKLHIREES